MKRIAWMLLMMLSVCIYANEEVQSVSFAKNKVFHAATLEFQSGKYQSTLDELIKNNR
jgi:hypothetical protein